MFFISSVRGVLWGITDTKDNVEEFYDKQTILKFVSSGIPIKGVTKSGNILIQSRNSMLIDKLEVGTPLKYKLPNGEFKQCLYCGFLEDKGYCFRDEDSTFAFSNRFLHAHPDVTFVTDDNDPCAVARIIESSKPKQ